jgi:hypothetical protein
MHLHASFTVASAGNVSGSWCLTISDIFRMAVHPAGRIDWTRRRCCWKLNRFDFNRCGVKSPVTDALQPGEALLCGLDRPVPTARRSYHDRALAAPKDPVVASDVVEEADAIARHPAVPHPVPQR